MISILVKIRMVNLSVVKLVSEVLQSSTTLWIHYSNTKLYSYSLSFVDDGMGDRVYFWLYSRIGFFQLELS